MKRILTLCSYAAHACGWRIMQEKQQEYEQSD